jgi:DeoR/GlpR family transcriptional regulator of sugar metabolism
MTGIIADATRRNPIARRARLRRELALRGAVSVADLSDILGASSATIRRDLDVLAREGVAVRGYGGAAVPSSRPAEEAFAIRERKDVAEKQAVVRATLPLVKNGETIFLNDGSTVAALARELAASELELFVVVSAVNVAHILIENPRITVCLLGGLMRRTSLATGGPIAETMLEQFNADRAILSSDAFSVEEGMSYTNADDASIARKMVARARHCVAMVTGRKFGWNARMAGIPAADIDVLVTDALPAGQGADLKAAGVSVIEART